MLLIVFITGIVVGYALFLLLSWKLNELAKQDDTCTYCGTNHWLD